MNTHFISACRCSAVALGLLAAMALVCTVEQALAAAVLRPNVYIMQMADSDKTAAATSEAKNSRMILWNYRPTATWEFRHKGNDTYTIRSNATYMTSKGGVGSPVIIMGESKNTNQRWRLKRVGKYFQIINVETGLAMELTSGQRAQGSTLQANTPNDSREQLFCIQSPSDPRYCGEGGAGESPQDKKSKKKNAKQAKPDATDAIPQGDQQEGSGTQNMFRNNE